MSIRDINHGHSWQRLEDFPFGIKLSIVAGHELLYSSPQGVMLDSIEAYDRVEIAIFNDRGSISPSQAYLPESLCQLWDPVCPEDGEYALGGVASYVTWEQVNEVRRGLNSM